MRDSYTEARQSWLRSIPSETAREIKVSTAIERMGTRYLCHPYNRVRRIWRGPTTK